MTSTSPRDTAEAAVLGALLLDPLVAMHQVVDEISEQDFQHPWRAALFDLICHMWADGQPIDPVTVYAAARNKRVSIPGEATTLHEMVASTPTAASAGFYAREVAQHAQRARLKRASLRIGQISEAGGDWGELMMHARVEWEAVANQSAGRLEARTLEEVLQGSDEYDWVIDGLLEREDRLILTGGEGAGKSTFVRQFAICASAGIHPFTHQPMPPVRIVVVDTENSEKQWRRACRGMVSQARKLGSQDPAKELRLATGGLDLTSERDIGAVHRLIDDHKPDILFIGPLYKLVPKAIQTDDDAAPLLHTLDGFRRRNVALVIEAHAPKGDGMGNRNLAPRGSAALQGWPEFGLGLKLVTEEFGPRTAEVTHWRGDRDEGRAWPLRLRAGGLFPWTDDRLEPQPGEQVTPWKPYFPSAN